MRKEEEEKKVKKGQRYSYDQSLNNIPDLRHTQSEPFRSKQMLIQESVFIDQNKNIISPMKQVQNCEMFPFKFIGKIKCYVFGQKFFQLFSIGTGTVIGKRTILTCAHNLINKEAQQPFLRIRFQLIINGQQREFSVAKVHYKQQYITETVDYRKSNYDYAFLILNEDLPFSQDELIRLAVDYNGRNTPIMISGYSKNEKDPSSQHQHVSRGYIQKIQNGRIYHFLSTESGASGAAVFLERDQKEFYIIGIHIGSVLNQKLMPIKNRAIHITEQLVTKNFQEWDPEPCARAVKLQSSTFIHVISIGNQYFSEQFSPVPLKQEIKIENNLKNKIVTATQSCLQFKKKEEQEQEQ